MDKWDQEFESKIRKKLSEGRVDFDETAWERMEQQLAERKGRRRLIPLWWLRAAAAVLLAGLGVWAYTGYFRDAGDKTRDIPSLAGNRPPANGELPPVSGEEQPGTKVLPAAPVEEPGASAEGRAEPGKGPVTAAEQRPAAGEQHPAPEDSRPVAGKTPQLTKELAGADLKPNTGEEMQERERWLAAKRERGLDVKGLSSGLALSAAAAPALAADFSGGHKQSGTASISAAGNGVPESGGTDASGTRLPVSGKKGITFSLGLLAAPDLNGVVNFNEGKLGVNMGLGLGVHFSERLSLHTGVVYSQKPYNARPSDYHTGYSPRDLVNIAANCNVIDIPLNLRYTVYRKGLTSISLNAGLSSYLMLREQYEYEYSSDEPRLYEYYNENRHFMGVGNAGITLERKISDKMSIGLTPFIKVPLTGIGHGGVRLISAGAAMGLNLDMSKKKNTNK